MNLERFSKYVKQTIETAHNINIPVSLFRILKYCMYFCNHLPFWAWNYPYCLFDAQSILQVIKEKF